MAGEVFIEKGGYIVLIHPPYGMIATGEISRSVYYLVFDKIGFRHLFQAIGLHGCRTINNGMTQAMVPVGDLS